MSGRAASAAKAVRQAPPALGLLALLCAGCAVQSRSAGSDPALPPSFSTEFDTVRVALPTGERAADRTSILAALGDVGPGGTVMFAPGIYVIGGLNLDVAVPGITLLGHPDGTTIRGCDPEVFGEFEVAALACNALGLSGGHQTVRDLTFEYAFHGITVGCCLPTDLEQLRSGAWRPEPTRAGGDIIEGNTFRYTPNGLRVLGRSAERTVIRENQFVDVYHAIGINGGGVDFLDNRIYTDQPHRVPTSTHPGDAINISPAGGPGDHTTCSDNVVAGNRIEGYTHGIRIGVHAPDTSCRRNIIRGNTIAVRRVPFVTHWFGIRLSDEADSTVVGVPVGLINYPMIEPGGDGRPESDRIPVIEDNVIDGNEISGGHGLGIEVAHASRNRIVNNSIRGIRARGPFPGNVLSEPVLWAKANGSGIWLSAGSDHNAIVGNFFEDIAASAVVIEGDSNQVELQSADDAVRDLGTGNRVIVTEQGSIAVLPFADMSPAKDQEYFSDGIAEELQDVLAQLPELRVAFRTSAFAFEGEDVGIDSIARALDVRHILEGSVRKAGDQVRITAQLIDASTGDHVWSETYDRRLKDIFQVQAEIAREIVDHLQLELGGDRAGAVLAKEETKDGEAHILFLRGRRLFRQYTREGFEHAEALLKQAIALDPAYARAHAALASVYKNQADQRHGPVEALMGQARAALGRALELDPNLARAHYVAGRMAYGSGDWHAAEASVARAVELNPGYVPAHALRAYLLAVLGRTEEAIAAAERVARLDPLSPYRQTDLASTYIYIRQYERAAEAYQSALALDPGNPSNLGNLGFVYALMGRHAEAIRAAEQARGLAPQEQWPLTVLAYTYVRADRRAEAEAVLRTLEALPEPDPYYRAIVYAGIGDRDNVFSLLEQAGAERNALVEGLGVDPVFDPYRSDPRMERLLERLDLPAESR